MEAQRDFEELFELLNKHRVKYMVVGGYALAFHGAPRYTGDIDILIEPNGKNAERILAALADFGFKSVKLSRSDFTSPKMVIQLGIPPVRIDIITSLTGISWKQAYAGRVKGHYGDVTINYIGKKQLVSNKKAVGRKKDLADIEALGEQ
jgi:hypothetical protein